MLFKQIFSPLVLCCSLVGFSGSVTGAAAHSVDLPRQVTYPQTLLTQQQGHDAIVKMAGQYLVNYEFEELYALDADYRRQEKKIRKGSDVVLIIENTPDKISLQHLLLAPNGDVIKHWRQDWQYQPQQAWQYLGDYQWQRLSYGPEQVRGKWLQTVWNADDSPRYASLGQWQNQGGVVYWRSDLTKRPLPRREYSKRQDYDLMLTINQHVLTPTGWVQEEDNWKFDVAQQRNLVKEKGTISYQRIADSNVAATAYWQKQQAYWQQVRLLWQQALLQNQFIALQSPEKQSEATHAAHFLKFLMQEQQLAEQSLSHKQLYQAAKILMNSELKHGQVQ